MRKMDYCIKMLYLKQIVKHYNNVYKDSLTIWNSMTTHPNEKVHYKGSAISLVIERECLEQFGKTKLSNRVFVTVCDLDGRVLSLDVWELISPTKIEFYSKNRSKADLTDYEVYEDAKKVNETLKIAYNELLKRYNELSKSIHESIQTDKKKKQIWSNHKGGRKRMFSDKDVDDIKAMIDDGISITETAKLYEVTRRTIYKYLKE